MTKIYPNQIKQFHAKVDTGDESALELIKLKSVALFKDGQPYKNLQHTQQSGIWYTSVVFNKEEDPGGYEVRWDFTFNGDPLDTKVDYVTLQKDVKINIEQKEVPSKNRDDQIPVPIILPTHGKPKFDQRYADFTEKSPFETQTCGGCSHFIAPDEDNPEGRCQIVAAFPFPILPKSWCRLWRDNYELEGYISRDFPIDDTLPEDVRALVEKI